MKLKQKQIFNFNVDEIEVYWTFSNYEKLLEWVNSSNSDFITFLDFTVKKSENLRDYTYKIEFWKNNYPCFAFYVWKQINSIIKTRDYFIVYWSAFRIIKLEEIIDFIDCYIELDHTDKKNGADFNTIKRFDLAVDITEDIWKILKNFKKLKQRWVQFYWNEWETDTYYIWEYQKRLNKRFLIRIYNKIKDIKHKRKQDLFWDYLLQDNITRIELEFRTELLKSVIFHDLLDREYIFNLFIKYLEKHTKLFSKLKTKDVPKLKSLNKKVSLEELKYDVVLKDRYIKSFLWYAKNILLIWVCPVDILFQMCVMSNLTKKDIILWIENWLFNPIKYKESLGVRTAKQIFADQISIEDEWYGN